MGTNPSLGPFMRQIAAYLCDFPMNVALPPTSLSAVQSRIEEIADRAGVQGAARLSVDDTLAALPWPARRRLVLALQSLKAFSPDPDVQNAAEFFRLKAAQVWAAMPFQGHSDEGSAEPAVLVERGTGHHAVTRAKKL